VQLRWSNVADMRWWFAYRHYKAGTVLVMSFRSTVLFGRESVVIKFDNLLDEMCQFCVM
jgi:hypothetical protein